TYSATAPGFVMGTGTVTLGLSGFVIGGPSGVGRGNFVVFTPNTTVTVSPALLDSSLKYVATQALAAGMSVDVNVSDSNPAVGTVSPTKVTFTGGLSAATTTFQRG